MIGCIVAENAPLEGGIKSSFSGTGWGAKGEFIRYFYLYPYIFESTTHISLESTCPELYAKQSKKPAEVLMVIWSGCLAPTRAFSKGAPIIFRTHMRSGMGTESLGIIGCIFAQNGPLQCGIESSFSGTGWGAKGDLRWILGLNACIFVGAPHHFPKAHALR